MGSWARCQNHRIEIYYPRIFDTTFIHKSAHFPVSNQKHLANGVTIHNRILDSTMFPIFIVWRLGKRVPIANYTIASVANKIHTITVT